MKQVDSKNKTLNNKDHWGIGTQPCFKALGDLWVKIGHGTWDSQIAVKKIVSFLILKPFFSLYHHEQRGLKFQH